MICIDKNKVLDKGTAAALGVFDGLHLGHQKVLGGALAAAEELGCAPAVFTFSQRQRYLKRYSGHADYRGG